MRLYCPLPAFLTIDQEIQISKVHLKSFPESRIAQLPFPDKLAYSPDCAAKVTRCLRERKQPGIDDRPFFRSGTIRLHEDTLVCACVIVRPNVTIFNYGKGDAIEKLAQKR